MRTTDKNLSNFINLALIAVLFPKAKIINVLRHPLDTCFACYSSKLEGTHGYSTSLQDTARYFLLYQDLMAHWRNVLPLKIHDIYYEWLTARPEEEIRRLVEFCGLPWNDACLYPDKSDREVRTISQWQVRQPISRKSVHRFANYEEFLSPLREILKTPLAEYPY